MFGNFNFRILFFILLFAKNAFAQLPLIRDAETERFLHNLSDPIFKAANLDPNNIKIYIINDDSINAFVSGGQNVFINTGLIRKFDTPDALIGVVAHETGHIAAGHLARSYENAKQAEGAMLLSYLLGIGAALGGSADAAQGLILGGSDTAQRLFMKFTRNQEEAADKHAVDYLDKISYPADGLVKLLEFFESEMIGYKGKIDEYLLSHPVSRKRIDLIKDRTKNKKFSDQKMNQPLQIPMQFILAKLEGFTDDPDFILQKYHNQNDKFSNYKKSIALFRKGNIKAAITLIDLVIASEDQKNCGFLYETRGQILLESGDIENAIITYDKSIKLLDKRDSPLIKIAFASAILNLQKNDNDLINLAIKNLQEAKIFEDDNPFLFKELSKAYDKIGDEGRSDLAIAEFNFLLGQKDKARKYAKLAKEKLSKKNKEDLLRADDLIELLKDEEKKDDDKKNL